MMRACRAFLLAASAASLLATGALAADDWHKDLPVVRFGLVVGDNPIYRLRQAEPFRRFLEGRLATAVEIVPSPDFASLSAGLAGRQVQAGVMSATAFAAAAVSCACVEPVATPTAADGAPGYRAILVTSAASPINGLAALKGMRVAFGPPDSVTGRIVPLAALAAEGIDPKSDFSGLVETATPKDALAALAEGRADAAFVWSSMTGDAAQGFSRGALTDMVAAGRTMADIRVVWQSGLIPYGPYVVAASLPADFKTALRDALVALAGEQPAALDAIDRNGGAGLVAAEARLFDGLEKALTAPGATR